MSEQMDLIPNEPKAVSAADKQDALMAMVLEKGNIEVLERFIQLRASEESRQSQLDFDKHFAEMQSEFVAAERSKKGYDYKYCPIEALQELYAPVISKHGFSYRWKEESMADNGKRCTLMISGWGFTKENSFDVPKIEGTKQMNPIQVAGAMSTYGRRYTFISGFGVIIRDEDNDAALSFNDGVNYSNEAAKIQNAKTIEELAKVWKEVYDGLTALKDQDGIKVCTVLKDKRKKELSRQ